MKRIAILWFFFIFSSSLNAQLRTDTFHLWKDVIPLEDRPRNEAKVMADTSRQVIRLTDVSDPILIAYHPENHNTSETSVVICPGGGYHHLAMNLEGSDIASWFNNLGITAFVLQYRVPGRREAALLDLQKALVVVHGNSHKWQLDPGKIGVMGFSAGGHLAMRAIFEGVRSEQYKPAFGILIYPAYFDEGPGRSLSPEFDITLDLPPVFVFGTATTGY